MSLEAISYSTSVKTVLHNFWVILEWSNIDKSHWSLSWDWSCSISCQQDVSLDHPWVDLQLARHTTSEIWISWNPLLACLRLNPMAADCLYSSQEWEHSGCGGFLETSDTVLLFAPWSCQTKLSKAGWFSTQAQLLLLPFNEWNYYFL